jgi:hypothetical protein
MDIDLLKKVIALIGGEDKVAGFILNNSARKIFRKGEFHYTECVDELNGVLIFKEHDPKGNNYTVYKPLFTIEAVIGVSSPDVLDALDQRYIGG